MKKYQILLLVIAFATSMLFIGISCKEKVVEEEKKISLSEEENPYEESIRLTNNSEDDGRPFWSPDGKMIAFESYQDGNWEVYVMNADGSGQTRLTNNPAFDG